MPAALTLSAPCPCGSGATEPSCCLPILHGEPAATAEALMRSRYTAYARGRVDHLLATWHPSTRPDDLELGDERWLGLRIVSIELGGPDDDEGVVSFEATWADGTGRHVLAERSAFTRRRGRWVYVDPVEG